MVPVINELKSQDRLTNCVIGSNGGETGEPDIETLVNLVGTPRANARIGVVSFSAGLFHPKVYHFTRQDGTQAAYVGSANLTTPGISGMNIEAGLLLDSSTGDPDHVLSDVAAAVDAWFHGPRPGLSTVTALADLAPLVAAGVLGVAPTPRTTQSSSGSSGAASSKIGLKPLIKFPPVSVKRGTVAALGSAAAAPSAPPSTATVAPSAGPLTSSPRPPFPPYVLFAPGIATPTLGAAALPTGAAEKIICLKNDNSLGLINGMFLTLEDIVDEGSLYFSAVVHDEDGRRVSPFDSDGRPGRLRIYKGHFEDHVAYDAKRHDRDWREKRKLPPFTCRASGSWKLPNSMRSAAPRSRASRHSSS